MSILLFHDLLNDNDRYYRRPLRLRDQHFGNALELENLLAPLALSCPVSNHYYRPWRSPSSELDQGSSVKQDKDKFQVNIDVQQFAPEEISVKVTDGNSIVVEGQHEEKQDEHGYISRHFMRRYVLPSGYNSQDIVSNLSSDGVLSIVAPKIQSEKSNERVVPITSTGPVKSVTEKKEEKKEGKK